MAKTPLRYPGGKSRAVKHILPLVPSDVTELCSPFLGGGSVELAFNQERGGTVYGYDLFKPLVWFWEALLGSPDELANTSDAMRVHDENFVMVKKDKDGNVTSRTKVRGLLKETCEEIRKELKKAKNSSIENAAKFYAINRSTFSGATFSGGWSNQAAYSRFTDSSIERVREFKVKNFHVACESFQTSILKHPDAFLYCDPPYLLGTDKDRLYGIGGDMHQGFPHRELYNILSERKGWVLSYNDCEDIRKLYSDYEIRDAEWAYGMKNVDSQVSADRRALEDLMLILKSPETKEMVQQILDGLKKKKMGSSSELLIIG